MIRNVWVKSLGWKWSGQAVSRARTGVVLSASRVRRNVCQTSRLFTTVPSSTPPSSTSSKESNTSSFEEPIPLSEKLHVAFTCTKCNTRSTRSMSRQAYTEGVVLIRCGGCEKLHLFADHLGWFGDDKSDIVSIMAEKGIKVNTIRADPRVQKVTVEPEVNNNVAYKTNAADGLVEVLPTQSK